MFVKQRILPSANGCEAGKLPSANIFEAMSNRRIQQLLAVEKNIYAKAKIFKSLHEMF